MVSRPKDAIAVKEEDLDSTNLSQCLAGLDMGGTDIEPVKKSRDGLFLACEIFRRCHDRSEQKVPTAKQKNVVGWLDLLNSTRHARSLEI